MCHVISRLARYLVQGLKYRTLLLMLLATAGLLAACASQTYQAKPLEPARLAEDFGQRRLDSAELRDYMLAQGYPEKAFPIKQWGLRELTLAAFFYHPQLEVARAQWRAAEAAEITAGQRPNPGVSGYLEHHSKTDGGISPWTYGISFAIPLEVAGKRQARMERAASLSEAARIEIGQSAWQVRSHLRDSLLLYQSALGKIALLEREAALQQELLKMLETRLQAGMASSLDLSNISLQWLRTQQALAAERGRLPGLRAAVAAAVGLPPQALDAISLDSSPPLARASTPEPLSSETIRRAGLLNRLDIRAALARYAAAEANLRLEIARQYPDIVLAPGYAWDQGDVQWTLGLSTILALMNRNQGPIAEARARRDVEASQFMALQSRVSGELEQALIEDLAVTERLSRTRQLLEAQQQQMRQIERQFQVGQADRLEQTTARLRVLTAEQGTQAAQIETQFALNALEDAVQQPLDGSTPLAEIPQESSRE